MATNSFSYRSCVNASRVNYIILSSLKHITLHTYISSPTNSDTVAAGGQFNYKMSNLHTATAATANLLLYCFITRIHVAANQVTRVPYSV